MDGVEVSEWEQIIDTVEERSMDYLTLTFEFDKGDSGEIPFLLEPNHYRSEMEEVRVEVIWRFIVIYFFVQKNIKSIAPTRHIIIIGAHQRIGDIRY